VEDLVETPFAWIGSIDEICAKLDRFAELGLRNYVIRSPAVADALRIVNAIR
jgi:hypothetical protein